MSEHDLLLMAAGWFLGNVVCVVFGLAALWFAVRGLDDDYASY